MSVFRKRETLVENITYMALMAAINVIFVLLTYFLPFMMFALIFVLPLSSTIVATYCKKRLYPIYAIVTVGVCLLVSMMDIGDTIFVVIPSIITGFLFGILIKQNIPSIIVIALTTIVQVVLTYPGLLLINQVIYPGKEDLFVVVCKMVGVTNESLISYIKHLLIGTICLIQQILTFIVIKSEIGKVGVEIEEKEWLDKLLPNIGIFVFSIFSVIFAVIFKQIAYLFMIGTALLGIYEIAVLILEKKGWIYISLGASLGGTIFLFAALYTVIPEPLGFLCIQVLFCLAGIIGLLNNYLLTGSKKR